MSIKKRIKQLITANTRDKSRYVQLREKTGISADIWKNFWFDRREPDANMIEKLARAWPEYAFWLATGITDAENGHKCPPSDFCLEEERPSLTTATAFFVAGIESMMLLETALEESPDEQDHIMKNVIEFLGGGQIHELPPKSLWRVDNLFKTIRKYRKAQLLRNKEAEMRLPA